MKISKKVINATEYVQPTTDADTIDIVEDAQSACYDDCISHIHQAIDCLAACANNADDTKAKEAIANLSVVLLDLQN